jgi:hypothetical protein
MANGGVVQAAKPWIGIRVGRGSQDGAGKIIGIITVTRSIALLVLIFPTQSRQKRNASHHHLRPHHGG